MKISSGKTLNSKKFLPNPILIPNQSSHLNLAVTIDYYSAYLVRFKASFVWKEESEGKYKYFLIFPIIIIFVKAHLKTLYDGRLKEVSSNQQVRRVTIDNMLIGQGVKLNSGPTHNQINSAPNIKFNFKIRTFNCNGLG